jgi:hypothetical protein
MTMNQLDELLARTVKFLALASGLLVGVLALIRAAV